MNTFTVKHIRPDHAHPNKTLGAKSETLYLANNVHFYYKESVHAQVVEFFENGALITLEDGDVFVVNESGKTVARYSF